ncbi:unnamed protein product [Jaminaea pallidilutea]
MAQTSSLQPPHNRAFVEVASAVSTRLSVGQQSSIERSSKSPVRFNPAAQVFRPSAGRFSPNPRALSLQSWAQPHASTTSPRPRSRRVHQSRPTVQYTPLPTTGHNSKPSMSAAVLSFLSKQTSPAKPRIRIVKLPKPAPLESHSDATEFILSGPVTAPPMMASVEQPPAPSEDSQQGEIKVLLPSPSTRQLVKEQTPSAAGSDIDDTLREASLRLLEASDVQASPTDKVERYLKAASGVMSLSIPVSGEPFSSGALSALGLDEDDDRVSTASPRLPSPDQPSSDSRPDKPSLKDIGAGFGYDVVEEDKNAVIGEDLRASRSEDADDSRSSSVDLEAPGRPDGVTAAPHNQSLQARMGHDADPDTSLRHRADTVNSHAHSSRYEGGGDQVDRGLPSSPARHFRLPSIKTSSFGSSAVIDADVLEHPFGVSKSADDTTGASPARPPFTFMPPLGAPKLPQGALRAQSSLAAATVGAGGSQPVRRKTHHPHATPLSGHSTSALTDVQEALVATAAMSKDQSTSYQDKCRRLSPQVTKVDDLHVATSNIDSEDASYEDFLEGLFAQLHGTLELWSAKILAIVAEGTAERTLHTSLKLDEAEKHALIQTIITALDTSVCTNFANFERVMSLQQQNLAIDAASRSARAALAIGTNMPSDGVPSSSVAKNARDDVVFDYVGSVLDTKLSSIKEELLTALQSNAADTTSSPSVISTLSNQMQDWSRSLNDFREHFEDRVTVKFLQTIIPHLDTLVSSNSMPNESMVNKLLERVTAAVRATHGDKSDIETVSALKASDLVRAVVDGLKPSLDELQSAAGELVPSAESLAASLRDVIRIERRGEMDNHNRLFGVSLQPLSAKLDIVHTRTGQLVEDQQSFIATVASLPAQLDAKLDAFIASQQARDEASAAAAKEAVKTNVPSVKVTSPKQSIDAEAMLRAELIAANSYASALKVEVVRLERFATNADERLQHLRARDAQYQERVSALQRRAHTAEGQLQGLETARSIAEQKATTLQTHIDHLGAELKASRDERNQEREAAAQATAELIARLSNVENGAKDVRSEAAQRMVEMESRVQNERKALEELRLRCAQLDGEKGLLQRQLTEQAAQLVSQKATEIATKRYFADLQQKLAAAEKKATDYDAQQHTAAGMESKLRDAEERLRSYHKAEELWRSSHRSSLVLQEENAFLQKTIAEHERDLVALKGSVVDRSELERVQEHLRVSQREVQRLQESIASGEISFDSVPMTTTTSRDSGVSLRMPSPAMARSNTDIMSPSLSVAHSSQGGQHQIPSTSSHESSLDSLASPASGRWTSLHGATPSPSVQSPATTNAAQRLDTSGGSSTSLNDGSTAWSFIGHQSPPTIDGRSSEKHADGTPLTPGPRHSSPRRPASSAATSSAGTTRTVAVKDADGWYH